MNILFSLDLLYWNKDKKKGENLMLYMTMSEFVFFMGLTSCIIKEVFFDRCVFEGSKRLYIIGSLVIRLFLIYVLHWQDQNLDDIGFICRNRFL